MSRSAQDLGEPKGIEGPGLWNGKGFSSQHPEKTLSLVLGLGLGRGQAAGAGVGVFCVARV